VKKEAKSRKGKYHQGKNPTRKVPEKEFLCKVCLKVFQQKGLRNRHQKEHFFEYGCKCCEKMCKRK
jgi:hypothetical protein